MPIKQAVKYETLFWVSIYPKWTNILCWLPKYKNLSKGNKKHRKRPKQLEAKDHTTISEQLYKRGKDGQLRIWAHESKCILVLEQAHALLARGHFFVGTTSKAILILSIWWPTLFNDANEVVKACDDCQRNRNQTQGIVCHYIPSWGHEPLQNGELFLWDPSIH